MKPAAHSERRIPAAQAANLTTGSLARSAVVLAAPLLLSNAGAVVFQVVDLSFLSRLGDQPMAAAIMINQTIWQVLLMMAMGASFGTQSLVARAVGAGDGERAGRTAGQALLLAASVSATVALVGLLFAPQLFSLSGARPEFADDGIPYLRLLLLMSFGLMGGMIARGVLVGAGDGRTPLIVSAVQFPVTLLVEWVLIFGHWGFPALGVRGAAIGIAAGQVASLMIYATVLWKGWSHVRIAAAHLRPQPAILAEIARQSWPPAVQMLSMVATTFAILRITRDFDPAVQAAYSIGLRLGMIVPLISFPLVNAAATLVGQALGAGDTPRAKATVRMMIIVHCAVMWPALAALAIFRVELLSLLTVDPAVLAEGSTYLSFFSISFALVAVYLVILRSLQGAGDFFGPMAISLGTTFLLTIPLAWILSRTAFGPVGIWSALVLNNIVVLTLTAYWMATGRWLRR